MCDGERGRSMAVAIVVSATAFSMARPRCASMSPVSTLPGPHSTTCVDALRGQRRGPSPPSAPARRLRHERGADRVRRQSAAARHVVRCTGTAGELAAALAPGRREPLGRRLHAAAVERCADRQAARRASRPSLRAAPSRARPLRDDRRSRSGPGALKLTGSTTWPCAASRAARRRRPRRRAPRSPPSRRAPAGTASCIACARKRTSGNASAKRERAGRDQRRVLAEAVPGDDRPAAPARLLRARRETATPAVSIAGCVFTVWLSASSGPSVDQRPQVLAQRGRAPRRT